MWFSLGAANNSLHGWHEYRQTQTAITVKYFIKEGWQLNYQTPIAGAPWKIPLEFPVYQSVVYVAHLILNGNLEAEGRVVSLVFFYLSLLIVYKLLILLKVVEKQTALLIISAILLSNYYLYWGSVFLIESTAMFFTLLYCYLLYLYFNTRKPRAALVLLMALAGIIAALSKVTTFLPACFVILLFTGLYYWYKVGFTRAIKKMLLPVILTVVSIAIQYGWVMYTDNIKAENPFASSWISTNISKWTFGTFTQRTNPANWLQFFSGLGHYQSALYLLVLLIATYNSIKDKKSRWFNALLLALFLCAPIIFFNLFKVHNYYAISINLYFIVFIFYNIFQLQHTIKFKPQVIKILSYTLASGIIALFAYRFVYVGYTDKFITSKHENNPYNSLLDFIGSHTLQNDYLIICGNELNPNITYYIDRKTLNTSLLAIDSMAIRTTILQRNANYNNAGLIVLDTTNTLNNNTASIWGFSSQPAYKQQVTDDAGNTRWLCYYAKTDK